MGISVESVGANGVRTVFSDMIAQVSGMIARRRIYNATYAQLNALSTRELDDLGISRSMISRLAHEAAHRN